MKTEYDFTIENFNTESRLWLWWLFSACEEGWLRFGDSCYREASLKNRYDMCRILCIFQFLSPWGNLTVTHITKYMVRCVPPYQYWSFLDALASLESMISWRYWKKIIESLSKIIRSPTENFLCPRIFKDTFKEYKLYKWYKYYNEKKWKN